MANADDLFEQAEDLSADDLFDQAEDLDAAPKAEEEGLLTNIAQGVMSAAGGLLSGAGSAIAGGARALVDPETYTDLAEGFQEGTLEEGYFTGELGGDSVSETVGNVLGQAATGKLGSNIAARLARSPESAARGAAQLPTLGFQDELTAAAGALLPPTETDVETGRGGYFSGMADRYRLVRDAERQAAAEALEEDPVAYFTGGALASVPQMIATGGLAAAGKGAAATTARLGTLGAVEGGVAGAGFSEATSAGELVQDIASGTTFGVTLGAGVPAAGAAAPAVARRLRKAGQVLRPATRAPGKKVTIEQLKRMNPAEAADEIENLNQAGFSYQKQIDDKIAQGEVLNKAQLEQQKAANIAFARQLEMRKLPEGIADAEDFLAGVGGQLRKSRKIIQDGQVKQLPIMGEGAATKEALGSRANKAVQFAKRTFDNIEDAHRQFLSAADVPNYAKALQKFDDTIAEFRTKQIEPVRKRAQAYADELKDLQEQQVRLELEGGSPKEIAKKLDDITKREQKAKLAQKRLRNQLRLARTQEQQYIQEAGKLLDDPRRRFLIDTNQIKDEILAQYKKEVFPQLEIGKKDVARDLEQALNSAVEGRRYATVSDLKGLKNSITNYFDTTFAGEGARAAKNKAGQIANKVLKKRMDKTVAEMANKEDILEYMSDAGMDTARAERALNQVSLEDYLEAKETFYLVNSMGDEVQNAALQGLQAPEISLGQVVSGYVAGAVTQNPFIGIATGLAQGYLEPRFPYISGRIREGVAETLRAPATVSKKLGAKEIMLKSPQAVEYFNQSTLPAGVKQIVQNSIQKGPAAFAANHYVLMNAYPQYREFMKEMEERTAEELDNLSTDQQGDFTFDATEEPYKDLAIDWEE